MGGLGMGSGWMRGEEGVGGDGEAVVRGWRGDR